MNKREQKFFRFEKFKKKEHFFILKIEIVRQLSPCAINRNLFSEFEIFGEKFSWILLFPLVHVRFICISVIMVDAHWQRFKHPTNIAVYPLSQWCIKLQIHFDVISIVNAFLICIKLKIRVQWPGGCEKLDSCQLNMRIIATIWCNHKIRRSCYDLSYQGYRPSRNVINPQRFCSLLLYNPIQFDNDIVSLLSNPPGFYSCHNLIVIRW